MTGVALQFDLVRYLCFQFYDEVSLFDHGFFAEVDGFDDAFAVGGNGAFHFHGFDGEEWGVDIYLIACLDEDAGEEAR